MDTIHGTTPGIQGRPIAWDLHPAAAADRPTVAVLHGFKGFKDWGFFPELARRLADAGFNAIRLNTSHNGVGLDDDASDFTRLDLFRKNRWSWELADVLTVLDALTSTTLAPDAPIDRSRIGLVGHSRGGALALLAAASRPAVVSSVVTWAAVSTTLPTSDQEQTFLAEGHLAIPNTRTGQIMIVDRTALDDVTPLPPSLDVERAAAQPGPPTLVLHGADDPAVSISAAHDIVGAQPDRMTLRVVDGADHVMNCRHPFAGPTPEFEIAWDATQRHLASSLG